MFNETMMDIITSISINSFASQSHTTADDILKKPYTEWGNSITGYSIFTSITRLTIAAFANNGLINYQNIIDSGRGILDVTTKMADGKLHFANDFLYGIIYDPLHIEQEFDKIMGSDYYRTFCEYLDRLFLNCLQKGKIPSKHIKMIMNTLPDFLNKRMKYYIQNGIINQREANTIVANFNQIWNAMQKEYQSFFSQRDINEIAKRANFKY